MPKSLRPDTTEIVLKLRVKMQNVTFCLDRDTEGMQTAKFMEDFYKIVCTEYCNTFFMKLRLS